MLCLLLQQAMNYQNGCDMKVDFSDRKLSAVAKGKWRIRVSITTMNQYPMRLPAFTQGQVDICQQWFNIHHNHVEKGFGNNIKVSMADNIFNIDSKQPPIKEMIFYDDIGALHLTYPTLTSTGKSTKHTTWLWTYPRRAKTSLHTEVSNYDTSGHPNVTILIIWNQQEWENVSFNSTF